MTATFSNLTSYLMTEGRSLSLRFVRTSTTDGKISWTIPTDHLAYDGLVIVGGPVELNPSNSPTNGVKYSASANLSSPADRIGAAQVVGAFYGDTTTASIIVTGLDPNEVYFFGAFIVTNTLLYFTEGVRSYIESSDSRVYAGQIPASAGPPANPVAGQVYYDSDQNLLFTWSGAEWVKSTAKNLLSGDTDPETPFTNFPPGYPLVGDYFYNTRVKMLKTWTGSAWRDAESVTGAAMYLARQGDTGEYTPRAKLIDVLKKQLGYPVICVELTEDHFNIAIDNALQEIRHRTDVAYAKQYFFCPTYKQQSVYYLNDPTTGTDSIVDVIKIHRLNTFGLTNFAADNIYAQQLLNQFYAPGVGFDLVSVFLISSMAETYQQLFAGEVSFNWREAKRELTVYRTMAISEKVLLETSCEKTEQELLTDRWVQQWIQQWAEAELMMMLGMIRGKFANLPGPGGGLSLNADVLISEAQRLQDDCLRQVRDFEIGQNGPDNSYPPFLMG